MADLTVAQNDYGFYINFTVNDADGNAYNLSGYTITLKTWVPGDPQNPVVTGACSIVDAASGTCRYSVASGDFPAARQYNAELQLTKSGVVESTTTFTVYSAPSA